MMQWIVVVGVLISNHYILPSVLAMSDEMKELAQMLHNSCVEETGVSEALIDKVNTEKVFADDENLKCYIKCLMAQMACIDDDGIIDEEATIAVLPEEMQDKAAPVIRACGTKKGANPCENAWLSHKCYAEMEPNAYMLV
nr:odorant binding protein 13 [Pagiophloeus tsushimanus]